MFRALLHERRSPLLRVRDAEERAASNGAADKDKPRSYNSTGTSNGNSKGRYNEV